MTNKAMEVLFICTKCQYRTMQSIKSIGTNIWNDTDNCFICGIRWFGAYHECELSPDSDLTIIRSTGRKKKKRNIK